MLLDICVLLAFVVLLWQVSLIMVGNMLKAIICTFFVAQIVLCEVAPAMAANRQVPVGKDPALSCKQAAALLKQDKFSSEDEKLVVKSKDMKCEVENYNRRHSKDQSENRKIAYMTLDQNDHKRVLFDIVTLKEAKKADALCKTLTGGFLAVAVPDANASTLLGALGSMRCDKYFDLAVKNDPLLIVFPTLAPEVRLTVEVIQTAREAAPKLAEYYKSHPGDVATIGMNPAAQGRLLQQFGRSVGGDVGKGLDHFGGEVNKTVKKICPRC